MQQYSRRRFTLRSLAAGFGAASVAAAASGASAAPELVAQAPAASAGRQFIKRPAAQRSGYSEAVVTQGGRIVWLAGHSFAVDSNGKSLAGNFDGQFREVFAQITKTLGEAGGKLSDMVTMTVFLTDVRNHRRFTQLRHDLFGDNFPASASITITALAGQDNLLEVQGVAVVA